MSFKILFTLLFVSFSLPLSHYDQGLFAQPLVNLDGKVFQGETGRSGKKAEKKETFVFRRGVLLARSFERLGYDQGSYRAYRAGGTIHFEAQTVSKRDGTINWKGTINRDILEGTFVWRRKQVRKILTYWMRGELKK